MLKQIFIPSLKRLKMSYKTLLIFLMVINTGATCFAQPAIVEDFKPSATTLPGKQFPQVNSESRVRTSIAAPGAIKVQLDIGGKKYDMVKGEKGVWTGESLPQDEGF